MIVRWPDTEELAALVPAGDPAAVKDDLDRIRTEMGRRDFRTKHLRDGRKAQREIAALRKALDGLSPYVESRLRHATRDAFVALYDPHGEFARGDVRHLHDVIPWRPAKIAAAWSRGARRPPAGPRRGRGRRYA